MSIQQKLWSTIIILQEILSSKAYYVLFSENENPLYILIVPSNSNMYKCCIVLNRLIFKFIPFYIFTSFNKLCAVSICFACCLVSTCSRYDSNQHKDKTCGYSQNKAYVIFSAMGSFFLPLIVMLYMYARISCVVAKRHDKLGQVQKDPKVYR